jgi:hypothetical protein
MSKEELDNLVRINRLKAEPATRSEFAGMANSAGRRLVDDKSIQIFLKAHNERNLAEYQGRMEIDETLLADLIRCTKKLATAVAKAGPSRMRHWRSPEDLSPKSQARPEGGAGSAGSGGNNAVRRPLILRIISR